jgi:hypothetical protein
MTGRRVGRWALLLELAMLAASLGTGGPVAHGVRVIGLIVVGVVGALVVFVAAVFTVGILAQRQPPYPMFGDLEVLAVLERDSSWPRDDARTGSSARQPAGPARSVWRSPDPGRAAGGPVGSQSRSD